MSGIKPATIGAFILSSAALLSASAGAQNYVYDDGGIVLVGYFSYPPGASDIALVEEQIEVANEIIWDATDGQMYIREFTLTADPRDREDAYVFFVPGQSGATSGRSAADYQPDEGRYQLKPGARPVIFRGYDRASRGATLAHELGHVVLGLQDEYAYDDVPGQCGGSGPCIDHETPTDSCIMQSYGGGRPNELCTHQNHDLIRGDGLEGEACVQNDQCTGCEYFNSQTGRFEGTYVAPAISCWEKVGQRFAFLQVPSQVVPDAGTAPTSIVHNRLTAPTHLQILLDTSGSMGEPAIGDSNQSGVKCIDANGDGNYDQTPCSLSRLHFAQQALSMFGSASRSDGFSVGMITFNTTADVVWPLQPFDATASDQLNALAATITPTGFTALGEALSKAGSLLAGSGPGVDPAILLISDGENTRGPEPQPIAEDLMADGVDIYTVVTGEAAQLGATGVLYGEHLRQSPQPASRITLGIMGQRARLLGHSELTPPLNYALTSKSTVTRTLPVESWPRHATSSSPPTRQVRTSLLVPPETSVVEIVLLETPNRTLAPDIGFTLKAPNGVSYSTRDPSSPWELTVAEGGLFARIHAPVAGTWQLAVQSATVGEDSGVFQVFGATQRSFATMEVYQVQPGMFQATAHAYDVTPLENLAHSTFFLTTADGAVMTLAATVDPEDPFTSMAQFDLRGKVGIHRVSWAAASSTSSTRAQIEPLFKGEPLSAPVTPLAFSAVDAVVVVKQ